MKFFNEMFVISSGLILASWMLMYISTDILMYIYINMETGNQFILLLVIFLGMMSLVTGWKGVSIFFLDREKYLKHYPVSFLIISVIALFGLWTMTPYISISLPLAILIIVVMFIDNYFIIKDFGQKLRGWKCIIIDDNSMMVKAPGGSVFYTDRKNPGRVRSDSKHEWELALENKSSYNLDKKIVSLIVRNNKLLL